MQVVRLVRVCAPPSFAIEARDGRVAVGAAMPAVDAASRLGAASSIGSGRRTTLKESLIRWIHS